MNPTPKQSKLEAGLDLFNHGDFFEAHEILEDLWRMEPGHDPSRRHCQGLVQLAVAFHHESTGNHLGAASVLERALRNLGGAESSFPQLDLERLRADLEPWRRYLELSNAAVGMRARDVGRKIPRLTAPKLPKIMRRS